MKIWGPAVLIPLGVIIVVVALIVAIGEFLLFLSRDISGAAAIAGAVVLLAIITAVAAFAAQRVSESK